jgi:hypothetical protein
MLRGLRFGKRTGALEVPHGTSGTKSPRRVAAVSAGTWTVSAPTSASLRPASRSSRRLDWTPRNSHDVDGVDDHVAGDGARLWGLGAYSLHLYTCVLLGAKHIINRGQKRGVRYADRFSTPGSSL